MIAASFIMPANKGIQAVSQAGNTASVEQKAIIFTRVVGTEVGKDLVNGALSTGVGYGVTELTGNQELDMAEGVLSSFAFGAELDAIDESLNISGLSHLRNTSNRKNILFADDLENKCVSHSETMRAKVESWANNEADELSKGSKRQRRKFNTAGVVYDESTGKYYYGRNSGISINNSHKNSILFGDENSNGILPEKSFNNYAVGNCAEMDAVNNALNDGAKLENLYMSTIHTTKSILIQINKRTKGYDNDKYTARRKTYARRSTELVWIAIRIIHRYVVSMLQYKDFRIDL